jgi:tight adherence protein C
MNMIFLISVGTTLFCGMGLIALLAVTMRSRAINARLLEVTQPVNHVDDRNQSSNGSEIILRMTRSLRERVGWSENPKLRERFLAAGIKSSQAVETFFAAQMLGPVAGILAGSFIPSNTLFWVMVFIIVGYMGPDFALDRMIKKRRERIRKAVPDSIDLLVICVDAGLGLDQAMLRVGQELIVSHPEINEEFLQINREQRAGKPRVDAWRSMAVRTKLPDIEGFVNMLIQTERFGTPIARALSTFADGLRLKRRQLAEERAAKTTVKMIFPLVIFIFPCMFIVLLGPAIISIMHGLSALTK